MLILLYRSTRSSRHPASVLAFFSIPLSRFDVLSTTRRGRRILLQISMEKYTKTLRAYNAALLRVGATNNVTSFVVTIAIGKVESASA
ncbi:hypothetical protein L204_105645 [Cryptococcus depauperatus]